MKTSKESIERLLHIQDLEENEGARKAETQSLKNQVQSLNASLTQAKTTTDALRHSMDQQLASVRNQLAQTERDRAVKVQEITKLHNLLATTQVDKDNRISTLERFLAETRDAKTHLTADKNQLVAQVALHEQNLLQSKQALVNATQNNVGHLSEITRLEAIIENITLVCDQRESVTADLKCKIEVQSQQLLESAKEIKTLHSREHLMEIGMRIIKNNHKTELSKLNGEYEIVQDENLLLKAELQANEEAILPIGEIAHI